MQGIHVELHIDAHKPKWKTRQNGVRWGIQL